MMQPRTEKYAIDSTASFFIATLFSYWFTPFFSSSFHTSFKFTWRTQIPIRCIRCDEDEDDQAEERINVCDVTSSTNPFRSFTNPFLYRCREHPSSLGKWSELGEKDDQWADRPITWKFPSRKRKLIDLLTNVTYSISHPSLLLVDRNRSSVNCTLSFCFPSRRKRNASIYICAPYTRQRETSPIADDIIKVRRRTNDDLQSVKDVLLFSFCLCNRSNDGEGWVTSTCCKDDQVLHLDCLFKICF